MTHDHSQAHGIYTCPMHPEVRQHGPGNCPICGMTLVPVEESAIKAVSMAPGGFDRVPEGCCGVVNTCPMHPEVRQTEPGSCPICGMGLERDATGGPDEGPNPELVDFTRRMWVGIALTLPLLVLSMGPLVGLGWIREILGEKQSMWIELALGTPVVLWCGWPFLVRGWVSFRTWRLNMFSLIAMGVLAAWLFSVVGVFAPHIFPDGFRDEHGHVGLYFEAAAVIVTLVLVGQVMELQAREGTGRAIRALLDLAAKTARVIRPRHPDRPDLRCLCNERFVSVGRAERAAAATGEHLTSSWSRKNLGSGLDLPTVGSPILTQQRSEQVRTQGEKSMLSLHIPNMNCGGCAKGVTAAIRAVDATARVEPDLPARMIAVETTLPEAAVREALAEAGFAPV